MILYIEDPRLAREGGKHFTLKYLLPRSTRKILIESIPPVNPPSNPEIEAPIKGPPFKLKIIHKREDWSNNYEDLQSVEETIELEVGKPRIFSEGSKVIMFSGATVGGTVGTAVGGIVGGVIGGVVGASVGALLPK